MSVYQDIAVEKFCEWLNLWFAQDDPPNQPLTMADFKPFTRTIVSIGYGIPNLEYRHLFVEAGYGDDGGNSFLAADFTHKRLVHLVQEIDGDYTVIYSQGQLQCTPTQKGRK